MAVDKCHSLRVRIPYNLRWLSNVFQYTYTLQISITLHKFAGLRCLEEIFLHWRRPPPTTACNIHQSSSSVYHNGRKFFKCKFIVLISVMCLTEHVFSIGIYTHGKWFWGSSVFTRTELQSRLNTASRAVLLTQSFHSLVRNLKRKNIILSQWTRQIIGNSASFVRSTPLFFSVIVLIIILLFQINNFSCFNNS